jgi:hypothetical protein
MVKVFLQIGFGEIFDSNNHQHVILIIYKAPDKFKGSRQIPKISN